ncbi:MAG: DUF3450 family protein [bacterium]
MLKLLPILLLLAPLGASARDAKGLAQALVELRQATESLNDQVEEARRAGIEQRRALTTQQTELDAEHTRASLRVAQLRETLERRKAEIAAATAWQSTLLPAFQDAARLLRGRVEKSLPFKRAERLEAIAGLERKVADGVLTPEAALARLWSLAEDELRMTRDTGLYRDTVALPEGEVLADVVRLGMVGLYWRTGDGRFGVVEADGRARTLTDPTATQQLEGLFDAFRKQIRVGAFTLPTLLAEAP